MRSAVLAGRADRISKQRISQARFSACGGSHQRHSSIPPQCDPPEGFCFIGEELSYKAKKGERPPNESKFIGRALPLLIRPCP